MLAMFPALLASLLRCINPPGDTPPPGPPWKLSCREARLDALAHGRPVFVYFSKTY